VRTRRRLKTNGGFNRDIEKSDKAIPIHERADADADIRAFAYVLVSRSNLQGWHSPELRVGECPGIYILKNPTYAKHM
jgi:hypothetical protein